jgi:hypothetical protein
VELYLHSTNRRSWRGGKLKSKNNFTFTFMLPPSSLQAHDGCSKVGILTYHYTVSQSRIPGLETNVVSISTTGDYMR